MSYDFRIAYGTPVNTMQEGYRHLVMLSSSVTCTGSLIGSANDAYILTAKHCLDSGTDPY